MSSQPPSDPDENPASTAPGGDEEEFETQPGEADLWELESDFSPPVEVIQTPRLQKFQLPDSEKRSTNEPPPSAIPIVPRGPRREELAFKAPAGGDSADTEEDLSALPASKPSPVRRRVTDTFADLEDEDGDSATPKTAPAKSAGPPPIKPEKAVEPTQAPPSVPAVESETEIPSGEAIPAGGFSFPKFQLTGLERICLIAFLALFAAAGIFYQTQSLNKLPGKKEALSPNDFPIKGKRVTALEIKSYWREPITDDRARIGTSLLPVVELKMEGGPAAIRVRFRDTSKEGYAGAGDAVTRQVKGNALLKVAGTAGFEELGMYASYRTGNTAPWVIEVLEGPAEGGSGDDFKKLFEIPVSTERR